MLMLCITNLGVIFNMHDAWVQCKLLVLLSGKKNFPRILLSFAETGQLRAGPALKHDAELHFEMANSSNLRFVVEPTLARRTSSRFATAATPKKN
jgi:hypothetical protein